ncbi:hypothetical protein DICVIV_07507 [Dictyocaulus viviparus]|uniref:ZP domain-containing protein n=1 Tax=Dictyocaulus viviparus TaxID=29172 RepID=A0A0D8XP69_DICVI|nr:hypothetical protein DICVIV_07507 [Dictyocaulus viviparus]
MCSSEGITASILFNRPFNGQIYSLNYGTVNDCIYYKGDNFDNILFSIPVHRCGTRLTRTTRNFYAIILLLGEIITPLHRNANEIESVSQNSRGTPHFFLNNSIIHRFLQTHGFLSIKQKYTF